MSKTTMELEKSTLGTLKQLCRKDQTYDEFLNHRIACNATGCNASGSIEMKVKAGKFGAICLYMCQECVAKLTDE
jgi:hypothetical protein